RASGMAPVPGADAGGATCPQAEPIDDASTKIKPRTAREACRFSPARPAGNAFATRPIIVSSSLAPDHRQDDAEPGALAGCAGDFQAAAVVLDHAVSNAQTQSRSVADPFCREKGVEDLRQDLLRDAAAVVGNLDDHLSPFHPRGELDPAALAMRRVDRLHGVDQ